VSSARPKSGRTLPLGRYPTTWKTAQRGAIGGIAAHGFVSERVQSASIVCRRFTGRRSLTYTPPEPGQKGTFLLCLDTILP
jgi:hypothetical protein